MCLLEAHHYGPFLVEELRSLRGAGEGWSKNPETTPLHGDIEVHQEPL